MEVHVSHFVGCMPQRKNNLHTSKETNPKAVEFALEQKYLDLHSGDQHLWESMCKIFLYQITEKKLQWKCPSAKEHFCM